LYILWQDGDADAKRQLHRLFGLRPWESIEAPGSFPATPGSAAAAFEAEGHELWQALAEAAEACKAATPRGRSTADGMAAMGSGRPVRSRRRRR
jgi:hypothetical protein